MCQANMKVLLRILLVSFTIYSCDAVKFHYAITQLWDGDSMDHPAISITLEGISSGVLVHVRAPFFNDPRNPGGKPGQPFPGLWDYEVAEVFFLNDADQYVEVEVAPHGQHLVLFLNGYRNDTASALPMVYVSNIDCDGTFWEGTALIPSEYFPPRVTKFNAYAIHGSDPNRNYMSLYPVSKGEFPQPDFHRLSAFQMIHFNELLPANWDAYSSQFWQTM